MPLRDSSMPSTADSSAPVRDILRRFRGNRQGSAAVEFAIVAPVFFALLFAIIETAIVFLGGQVLETMVQQSARMVMTGQAQSKLYSQSDFHDYVCKQIPALFDCSKIYVDVQNYPAGFPGVPPASQIDGSKNFINNMKYCPGNAGDIVVVRLFYQWPLFVTGMGYDISNLAGGARLLSATAAFRNEPFAVNPSACS
jgi:Flp pilus assembly protein TadG